MFVFWYVFLEMKITDKIKCLKSHGLNYMSNVQKTQLIAEEEWTRRRDDGSVEVGSTLVNVSQWSRTKFMGWLGY